MILRAPLTWLAGISVVALAVTLLLPQTGWISREQWISVLTGAASPAERLPLTPAIQQAYHAIAIAHPNDFQIQLANSASFVSEFRAIGAFDKYANRPIVTAIGSLAPRFNDRPAFWANKLRFESELLQPIGRQSEIRSLSHDGSAGGDFGKPHYTRPQVDTYIADAIAGERVDPDNAYFPFMESAALFAERRDAEAVSAIELAGTKPRFTDYEIDEVLGHWRMQELAFGDASSAYRLMSSIPNTDPTAMMLTDSIARLATVTAIKHERGGDTLGGIRIRAALIRCGALMRDGNPTTVIAGIGLATVAIVRPGGVSAQAASTSPGQSAKTSARADFAIGVSNYGSFLMRHGETAEWEWAQQYLLESDSARHLIADVSTLDITAPLDAIIWWIADMALASAALVSLLAALAGRLLSARSAAEPEEEPSLRVKRGVALAVIVAAGLYGAACVKCLWSVNGTWGTVGLAILITAIGAAVVVLFSWRAVFAAVLALAPPAVLIVVLVTNASQFFETNYVLLLLALVAGFVLVFAGVRELRKLARTQNMQFDLRAFGLAAGIIAILATAIWFTTCPAGAYADMLLAAELSTAFLQATGPNIVPDLSTVIVGAIPVAFLVAAFFAWRKRPARTAAFVSTAGIVLASCVVLVYCGCIFLTASAERHASNILRLQAEGQWGRLAEMAGRTPPPYVPPPPMP
jgi:MFS family permease